jgi:uracil phosphoribosyltransferase
MKEKLHNLSEQHSLISNWISELRNIHIQQDRMRFRRNLERIGEVIGYEISKTLPAETQEIHTPLGKHLSKTLSAQPVLATILRAGLPLHQGLLNYFDRADNAFLAAYRKHTDEIHFEIELEYLSCPDLNGRTIILCDPMLATGASLVKCWEQMQSAGKANKLHIVCAIASMPGVDYVQKHIPEAEIWCGDIDPELTDKGYIHPGLGDAGDLAFGQKAQH